MLRRRHEISALVHPYHTRHDLELVLRLDQNYSADVGQQWHLLDRGWHHVLTHQSRVGCLGLAVRGPSLVMERGTSDATRSYEELLFVR